MQNRTDCRAAAITDNQYRNLSTDGYERAALRQEKARPVFDDREVWLQAQLPRLSGKTKLAEAIRYALKPMPEARAYLGDGRLELQTRQGGICREHSIRLPAFFALVPSQTPGRKNCLFPGSVGGGEAAAIAYALIETAEMNNVDPEAWLTWVLERIADHRLTPSTNSCRGTGSPKTSKTRPDRTDTIDFSTYPNHVVPGRCRRTRNDG